MFTFFNINQVFEYYNYIANKVGQIDFFCTFFNHHSVVYETSGNCMLPCSSRLLSNPAGAAGWGKHAIAAVAGTVRCVSACERVLVFLASLSLSCVLETLSLRILHLYTPNSTYQILLLCQRLAGGFSDRSSLKEVVAVVSELSDTHTFISLMFTVFTDDSFFISFVWKWANHMSKCCLACLTPFRPVICHDELLRSPPDVADLLRLCWFNNFSLILVLPLWLSRLLSYIKSLFVHFKCVYCQY